MIFFFQTAPWSPSKYCASVRAVPMTWLITCSHVVLRSTLLADICIRNVTGFPCLSGEISRYPGAPSPLYQNGIREHRMRRQRAYSTSSPHDSPQVYPFLLFDMSLSTSDPGSGSISSNRSSSILSFNIPTILPRSSQKTIQCQPTSYHRVKFPRRTSHQMIFPNPACSTSLPLSKKRTLPDTY